MSSHTFSGPIPEYYDTYLGPFLFEFSAEDLAGRVGEAVPNAEHILEIACGTGISTEYLRKALPVRTRITATDVNEAMLAVARKKRGDLANVSYEVADAVSLPYDDATFDAVVVQFGVMFYPDKEQGFREMHRVLSPGGFLAFNVWDSIEHNRIVAVAADTIMTFFDEEPPAFLKIPFGFNDKEMIRKLAEGSGFTDVHFETVTGTIDTVSAEHIAQGAVRGNPTVSEIEARATADADTIVKAVTEAIVREFCSDPPKVELQEIVCTARKPA